MPDFMKDFGHFPSQELSLEDQSGFAVGDEVCAMKDGHRGCVMQIGPTSMTVQSEKDGLFEVGDTFVGPNGVSKIKDARKAT